MRWNHPIGGTKTNLIRDAHVRIRIRLGKYVHTERSKFLPNESHSHHRAQIQSLTSINSLTVMNLFAMGSTVAAKIGWVL